MQFLCAGIVLHRLLVENLDVIRLRDVKQHGVAQHLVDERQVVENRRVLVHRRDRDVARGPAAFDLAQNRREQHQVAETAGAHEEDAVAIQVARDAGSERVTVLGIMNSIIKRLDRNQLPPTREHQQLRAHHVVDQVAAGLNRFASNVNAGGEFKDVHVRYIDDSHRSSRQARK